jgi:fumarylpyruvate hydrolase
MSHVLPPPSVPAVPVVGGDAGATFPVHRIYCVGRNYAEHAIEMGGTGREAPFFFMKPADAVVPVAEGQVGRVEFPSLTNDLHHEIEWVVAIGKGGRNIPAAQALDHVWGYAVGLDLTRRDLQAAAKKEGRPWDIAKGFEQSAPIGPIRPAAQCQADAEAAIALDVNGQPRQKSVLGKMIWSLPEIIEHLSAAWDLAPGDLIFTGTPEGVARLAVGDRLDARIDGVGRLQVELVERQPLAR